MRHRLAARGLLPQEIQTSRGRETGTREARDSFLEARSSTPQWRAPHAGTHADPEVQSWSCAAVAGQGLGRLPGPLGRYPGHGRGVCGPREHQASVRPAPVCSALLCVSHLSPGGLQPLEVSLITGVPLNMRPRYKDFMLLAMLKGTQGRISCGTGVRGVRWGVPGLSPS